MGLSGPAPVPLSEIKAYCDLFSVTDPDDIAEFVSLMRDMDSVYIEEASKKQKSGDGRK